MLMLEFLQYFVNEMMTMVTVLEKNPRLSSLAVKLNVSLLTNPPVIFDSTENVIEDILIADNCTVGVDYSSSLMLYKHNLRLKIIEDFDVVPTLNYGFLFSRNLRIKSDLQEIFFSESVGNLYERLLQKYFQKLYPELFIIRHEDSGQEVRRLNIQDLLEIFYFLCIGAGIALTVFLVEKLFPFLRNRTSTLYLQKRFKK